MAKRRTAAQKAATARMLASRAGTAVATRTRTVVRRVASAPRTIIQTVRAPRRGRRAAAAIVRGGSAMAIAQARILPGMVGGYIVAKVERDQRMKAANTAGGNQGSKPLIADPVNRLLAEGVALALIASRTQGMVREVAVGAAGAVGALYELYTAKPDANGKGYNPVDGYADEVRGGGTGV